MTIPWARFQGCWKALDKPEEPNDGILQSCPINASLGSLKRVRWTQEVPICPQTVADPSLLGGYILGRLNCRAPDHPLNTQLPPRLTSPPNQHTLSLSFSVAYLPAVLFSTDILLCARPLNPLSSKPINSIPTSLPSQRRGHLFTASSGNPEIQPLNLHRLPGTSSPPPFGLRVKENFHFSSHIFHPSTDSSSTLIALACPQPFNSTCPLDSPSPPTVPASSSPYPTAFLLSKTWPHPANHAAHSRTAKNSPSASSATALSAKAISAASTACSSLIPAAV
ncbi:conserved hypothetical protein [Uncinocarpus reesii 1704]|uniref:Uncharacterized protein n=1 Tax=Uncinocarpus reesii (strain UAMH 1704) TaxID=336963 RepID=C4JPG4_UNCRE|nr:uncharacterized protein UREG_04546 [Uncinocarpus reesii 1704]EEP79700.1 conserved hypothetical protein [Uncinocarpus reesii 1704]